MKVFLDTSALLKMYHREDGTVEMERLFQENKIEKIFLAEITTVEFFSSVAKKYRVGEMLIGFAGMEVIGGLSREAMEHKWKVEEE